MGISKILAEIELYDAYSFFLSMTSLARYIHLYHAPLFKAIPVALCKNCHANRLNQLSYLQDMAVYLTVKDR